jgi:hypothetical protein
VKSSITAPTAFALISAAISFGQELGAVRDRRYFPLTQVSPVFRPYLIAAGNRLDKAGRERVTAAGTIQFGPDGGGQVSAAQFALQMPSQVRIDLAGASVVYDGKNSPQAVPGSSRDVDAIETLVEDSLEGLLLIGSDKGSARFLGTGIRDSSAKGPAVFFDVIQVLYRTKIRAGAKQSKMYFFDTATKLLARVEHEPRPGVRLQVNLKDWRDVQGTKIPFQIERRENDVVTLRITLTAAQLGEGKDDLPFKGK